MKGIKQLRVGRREGLIGVAAMVAVAMAVPSCSSTRQEEVASQASQALIGYSSTNHRVAFSADSETDVAYAPGTGTTLNPGNWVMVANALGGPNTKLAWGYSSDNQGTSWTFQQQTSGPQFGTPPTTSPDDGSFFTGWTGDLMVAPVTNPSWNNAGKRVLVVSMASTTANPGAANDVIVTLSEDGGKNWGTADLTTPPQYLDDSTSGGLGTGPADQPGIYSNPVPPFDTWATWTPLNRGHGFMRKVEFGPNPGDPLFPISPSRPLISIPLETGDSTVDGYRMGFGVLPSGCGSQVTAGGEAIYVVYDNDAARCNRAANLGRGCTNGGTVKFNLALYDVAKNTWWPKAGNPAWTLDSDSNYCFCSGEPNGPPAYPASSNVSQDGSAQPTIAADPFSSDFWVSYTKNSGLDMRATAYHGRISCSGGDPSVTPVNIWTDPSSCTGGGCTLPDGGPIHNDDWSPSVTLNYTWVYPGPTLSGPRVVMEFQSTRDDPNNNQEGSYMITSENLVDMAGAPQRISTIGGSGLAIWPLGSNDDSDYQIMGVSEAWFPPFYMGAPPNSSFMAVWAADQRSGSGVRIMSEFIQ